MNKKAIYIVVGLLFISISINIYQLVNKTVLSTKVNQLESKISAIKKEESTKEENEEPLNNDNPLDKFFEKHELKSSTTVAMIEYSGLYCRLWEAEMKHAYAVLDKASHNDIKPTIKAAKINYIRYAKNEAEIAAAVQASSAFDEEAGADITYGSLAPIIINDTIAQLYKDKTIEIFNYLNSLGIKIDFVFNEKNLSKEDRLMLEY